MAQGAACSTVTESGAERAGQWPRLTSACWDCKVSARILAFDLSQSFLLGELEVSKDASIIFAIVSLPELPAVQGQQVHDAGQGLSRSLSAF